MHHSIRELMPRSGKGKHGEEVTLEPDEQEMADIDVVSEKTRPGKPLIDKILAEEVESAKGSVVVACEYGQIIRLLGRMNTLPSVLLLLSFVTFFFCSFLYQFASIFFGLMTIMVT
jgi:hypothetical protein